MVNFDILWNFLILQVCVEMTHALQGDRETEEMNVYDSSRMAQLH